MNHLQFSELFDFQKKSKVKAGEGNSIGEYPFYTSSTELSKCIDMFQFDKTSLVFGTGGQASIHYSDVKFSVSTDCLVAQKKSNNEVYVKFVYYYLYGNISLLEEGFRGAGLKHISKTYISQLKIPVPQLETQTKIAAILDKADELIQNDKKILEKYDQLAQSVFLDMFGNIDRNDKQWKKLTLGAVSDSRLGKMLDKKKITGKYLKPYIQNRNVQWGKFELDHLQEMDFTEKERIEFRLMKDDVLVCEGGEVGRAAIWKDELSECYYQKALHRVRVHSEKLNPEYLVWWLREMSRLNGFKDYVSSVTISHLTGVKLKSMKIALPPPDLQTEFETTMKKIELQKQLTQQSQKKSEELFQSLLQRAFKGELV